MSPAKVPCHRDAHKYQASDASKLAPKAVSKLTPPNSFIELPPSPPATDERAQPLALLCPAALFLKELGVELIHDLTPWTRRTVELGIYDATLRRLQHEDPALYEYINNKLRHDVSATEVVLRMPSTIHELIAEGVKTTIIRKLQELKATVNESTSNLIDSILSGKSARIRLDDGTFREPDDQFRVKGFRFPGIVLEVANTQKDRDLATVADDFIVETIGDIRMVIGLRIAIDTTKRAGLQVWQPKFVDDENEQDAEYISSQKTMDEDFRRPNGSRCAGVLQIPLSSFAAEPLLLTHFPNATLNSYITLTFEELTNLLGAAEAESVAVEKGFGRRAIHRKKIKKRKRDLTPEERLVTDDEDAFQVMEEKVKRRGEVGDGEYRPGMRRP